MKGICLSLPKTDEPSRAQWVAIGNAYMKRLVGRPRAYILHDDQDGQHIHIIASNLKGSSR